MKKMLRIKVIPRSSRNEIVGEMTSGAIKIKLTAAPVDGEANKKLIALLSKEWNIPKSGITIVKGEKGKEKVIEIDI